MKSRMESKISGFTLIELLTVIAIIAILASITLGVLPGVRIRAKITKTEATFASVRTALANYYTSYGSFPAGYGYRALEDPLGDDSADYYLTPYYRLMQLPDTDFLDPFAFSYDTNSPSQGIDLLEFCPIGVQVLTQVTLPTTRFLPGGPMPGDVANDIAAMAKRQRPLIYIPVYSEHMEKVQKFYMNASSVTRNKLYAAEWDPDNTRLASISFPPPRYDRYVLLSVGPNADTGGVLPDPLGNEPLEDLYSRTALRAYFLATRDLDGDGKPDFDWRARTRGPAGKPDTYASVGLPDLNLLPNGTNGAGPLIFIGN